MDINRTLTNPTQKPLALTIGNFDGVHIGHQAIINTLVQTAVQQQYHVAAMTFSPHAKVFFGSATDFLIISDDEKAEYMASHGIETLYQIPFTHDFACIEASDFVDLLIHQLQVKYLLVGDDFRFGHRGYGNFQLLKALCDAHQVAVQHTPTIKYGTARVSSSRVRQAIKASDFDLVANLLSRRLDYHGSVIRGQQLGRQIDFPTANIRLPAIRLLPEGVFAVRASVGDAVAQARGGVYQGMCNIGTKPTVDDSHTRQIETHLFDFDADLYGQTLIVEPVAKIRDEQKFDGVEALVAQLHRDRKAALSLLSSPLPQL